MQAEWGASAGDVPPSPAGAISSPAGKKRSQHKKNREDRRRWLFIKWQGLTYIESTWETCADAQDDITFQAYCRNNLLGSDGLKLANRPSPPTPKRRDQLQKEFKQYTQSPKFPNGGSLRSYQVDSLNWLTFNWMLGRNSMLADEMGLGKTLQTASFTRHLYTQARTPRSEPK